MHGIVSLLDKRNDARVRLLWKDLDESFHLKGVYGTPYPHFSYQVASDYDVVRLETALRKFTKRAKPFAVHAGGLGVFSGPNPVLYIPVTRTLELSTLHLSLWRAVTPFGSAVSSHYKPENWVPHITLAQSDINQRNLADVVGSLSKKALSLTIEVDNLGLICDDGRAQTVLSKFPFAG